jgi:hypothetical protein
VSAGVLGEKPYRLEVNVDHLKTRKGKPDGAASESFMMIRGVGGAETSPNGEDAYVLHPSHSRRNQCSVISVGYQHN